MHGGAVHGTNACAVVIHRRTQRNITAGGGRGFLISSHLICRT